MNKFKIGLTLPQKIILSSFLSVLLGVLGGALGNVVYAFLKGDQTPNTAAIVILIILFFLLLFFYIIVFRQETDAETFFNQMLFENKVAFETASANKQKEASRAKAETAIYDEIEKLVKNGDTDKAHSLAELKGKI